MGDDTPLFASSRSVRRFTLVWLLGTTLVSVYFAFWLFPEIYEKRTSAVVQVNFQTVERPSPNSEEIVYYPNQPAFLSKHGAARSDNTFLYFSACEVLPLSQRPICDPSRNWKKLDPSKVHCRGVSDCSADTYRMNEDDRYVLLSGIKPSAGANFSIGDLQSPSLSDPGGWGKAAQLPIFFICMFLGLKLGRSAGEFLFSPYAK